MQRRKEKENIDGNQLFQILFDMESNTNNEISHGKKNIEVI